MLFKVKNRNKSKRLYDIICGFSQSAANPAKKG
jgi:hypothetical protein